MNRSNWACPLGVESKRGAGIDAFATLVPLPLIKPARLLLSYTRADSYRRVARYYQVDYDPAPKTLTWQEDREKKAIAAKLVLDRH